jgi:predicted transcriptional regulator
VTRATRSDLIISILKLIWAREPQSWSVEELVLATGRNRRAVERAIQALREEDLIERHYQNYKISTTVYHRVLEARWWVKQKLEKDLFITRLKNG